jgi:hypothetical protein
MKIENEEELKRQIQDCVFPVHITENLKFCNRGLTKREYFAAMAMQALLTSSWQKVNPSEEFLGEMATTAADNLIKHLNK